jgi:aldehyde dehydrogenase (NAD+)
VLDYLEIGKGEAKLALGGERVGDKGFFVTPTVFVGVDRNARIAQEEIFGPVLSIIEVADFEEAIAVANDVKFGLTSSIYSRDTTRVFQYLESIETGITHVNSPTVGGEAQMPFGGMKATGVGAREMGRTAIEFYSEWKAVYVDYTGAKRTTNIY